MSFSASCDSGTAPADVCGGTIVETEKLSLDGLGSVSFEPVGASVLGFRAVAPPIEAALRGLFMIR